MSLREKILALLPAAAGFRTRYRSEPGMIGHYPWTYADQRRRRPDRPEVESEDLYTAEQVKAAAAEAAAPYEALIAELVLHLQAIAMQADSPHVPPAQSLGYIRRDAMAALQSAAALQKDTP